MKVFLLLAILPMTLNAAGIADCGEYSIKGVVRALPEGLTLVVNEKTKSEYKISLPVLEQGKVGGFINRPVLVKALLDKPFNGTLGKTDKIISVEFRVPDPMLPADTGFTLDKKTNCRKED